MLKVIPGHQYFVYNFESPHKEQVIQFIHKEMDADGNLKTVSDGTTNEEVLRVLIDRMKFLNEKMPCRENAIVITKLEECLMWLEKRTAERKARGVEGTHKA